MKNNNPEKTIKLNNQKLRNRLSGCVYIQSFHIILREVFSEHLCFFVLERYVINCVCMYNQIKMFTVDFFLEF